jgi:hypothetical protein
MVDGCFNMTAQLPIVKPSTDGEDGPTLRPEPHSVDDAGGGGGALELTVPVASTARRFRSRRTYGRAAELANISFEVRRRLGLRVDDGDEIEARGLAEDAEVVPAHAADADEEQSRVRGAHETVLRMGQQRKLASAAPALGATAPWSRHSERAEPERCQAPVGRA